MAIAAAAVEKLAAIDHVTISRIKRAALALARGPVALEIAQVRDGADGTLAAQFDDPRLDYHAPRPGMRKPIATADDPTHPRAARERPRERLRCALRAGATTGQIDHALQLAGDTPVAADSARPEAELIIVGHGADAFEGGPKP